MTVLQVIVAHSVHYLIRSNYASIKNLQYTSSCVRPEFLNLEQLSVGFVNLYYTAGAVAVCYERAQKFFENILQCCPNFPPSIYHNLHK